MLFHTLKWNRKTASPIPLRDETSLVALEVVEISCDRTSAGPGGHLTDHPSEHLFSETFRVSRKKNTSLSIDFFLFLLIVWFGFPSAQDLHKGRSGMPLKESKDLNEKSKQKAQNSRQKQTSAQVAKYPNFFLKS